VHAAASLRFSAACRSPILQSMDVCRALPHVVTAGTMRAPSREAGVAAAT
jgi:hypothetical protein